MCFSQGLGQAPYPVMGNLMLQNTKTFWARLSFAKRPFSIPTHMCPSAPSKIIKTWFDESRVEKLDLHGNLILTPSSTFEMN